jgi:hypothetical protein
MNPGSYPVGAMPCPCQAYHPPGFRLERLHDYNELVGVQSNNNDRGSEPGEISIDKAFDAVIQSALNLELENRNLNEFDVNLMAIAGLDEGILLIECNPENDIPDDWKRLRRARKVGSLHCDPEPDNGELNAR